MRLRRRRLLQRYHQPLLREADDNQRRSSHPRCPENGRTHPSALRHAPASNVERMDGRESLPSCTERTARGSTFQGSVLRQEAWRQPRWRGSLRKRRPFDRRRHHAAPWKQHGHEEKRSWQRKRRLRRPSESHQASVERSRRSGCPPLAADRQWRYRRATRAWWRCDQPLAMALLESLKAEQRMVTGYTESSASCLWRHVPFRPAAAATGRVVTITRARTRSRTRGAWGDSRGSGRIRLKCMRHTAKRHTCARQRTNRCAQPRGLACSQRQIGTSGPHGLPAGGLLADCIRLRWTIATVWGWPLLVGGGAATARSSWARALSFCCCVLWRLSACKWRNRPGRCCDG